MATKVTRILTKADPAKLVKHPRSLAIYGEKADAGFDESIAARGIDEPIALAADGKTIISGVRRRNAAIKAKMKEVPVFVRQDLVDDLDIREAIVESNRHNEQTTEAKARAFAELKAIEELRADQRKKKQLKRGKSPVSLNLDAREKGRADTKAAEQVGMKKDTARKAAEVVQKIDEAEEAGDLDAAKDLRETLEHSVTAAHKKATSKPEKSSNASIVKDKFGRDVIDDLREHHGLIAVLLTLGNSLDKARREVKELATVKGGEWLESQHIDGLLRDAKRGIQKAAFLCECPKCRGEVKATCVRCEGTGYVPQRHEGILSDDEKGWLGI